MRGGLLALSRFSLQKQFWLLHRFCWKPPCMNYWSKSKHSFSPRGFHLSRSTDYLHLLLSLKWPGHFANSHWLQSLSTVCFRSLEQKNFAHIHEGRALEQQHWETGDSPWKSDQRLKVLRYSTNLDSDEGCTYSPLNWSKWLLQVPAFPSREKKIACEKSG